MTIQVSNADRVALDALRGDPGDAERLVAGVDAAFDERGLVLETFDRFRS